MHVTTVKFVVRRPGGPKTLNIFAGVKRNFLFFANWNTRRDNTPQRRKNARKVHTVMEIPKGGLFFEGEPPTWDLLKREFPSLVSESKFESVILQCGTTVPQEPTKGVRLQNSITSKSNIAKIEANFLALPESMRRWIQDVQLAIGIRYDVDGYDAAETRPAALLKDVMLYESETARTSHYVIKGDAAARETFVAIERLPSPTFDACHMQIDSPFDLTKLSDVFTHMFAVAGPKFVTLVPFI